MKEIVKYQRFKFISMISLTMTSTLFSNRFHPSIEISKKQIVSYQAFQVPFISEYFLAKVCTWFTHIIVFIGSLRYHESYKYSFYIEYTKHFLYLLHSEKCRLQKRTGTIKTYTLQGQVLLKYLKPT